MVDFNDNKDSIETRRGMALALIKGSVAIVGGFAAIVGVAFAGGIESSDRIYTAEDSTVVFDQAITGMDKIMLVSQEDDGVVTLVVPAGGTIWGEVSDLYLTGERIDPDGQKERFIAEEVQWLRNMTTLDLDNVQPGFVIEYSVRGSWARTGEDEAVVELLQPANHAYDGSEPTSNPQLGTSAPQDSAAAHQTVASPPFQCSVLNAVLDC